MGAPDPSMVQGILGKLMGGAGSGDRSNQLIGGILNACADHLMSAPDASGGDSGAPDLGAPPDLGLPMTKPPAKKSEGSKKPASKSASSKKASSK